MSLENLWQRLQKQTASSDESTATNSATSSSSSPLHMVICGNAENKSALVAALLSSFQNVSDLLFQHHQLMLEENSVTVPSHVKRGVLQQRQHSREAVSATAAMWARSRRAHGVGCEIETLLLPSLASTELSTGTPESTAGANTQAQQVQFHVVDFPNLLEAATTRQQKREQHKNGDEVTLLLICVDGDEPVESVLSSVELWREAARTAFTKKQEGAAAERKTTLFSDDVKSKFAASAELPVCDADSLDITLASDEKAFVAGGSATSLVLPLIVRVVDPMTSGDNSMDKTNDMHRQFLRRLAMESSCGFAEVPLAPAAVSAASSSTAQRGVVSDAIAAVALGFAAAAASSSPASAVLSSAAAGGETAPDLPQSQRWFPLFGVDSIGRLSLPQARASDTEALQKTLSQMQHQEREKLRRGQQQQRAQEHANVAVPAEFLHSSVLNRVAMKQLQDEGDGTGAKSAGGGGSGGEKGAAAAAAADAAARADEEGAPAWDEF